ncbi:MAG: helix-turn-helix transcriptional regulator [Clostridium sp.]|uniref:helix-turn-helix transcriptional regulator n=1 Tax=Clostridium sp. TaxID=1506 RepID=UPI003F2F509E
MKIDRLISIIMVLNNKEKVTAKELSEKFNVSIKTITRDMRTIEEAGIPIISYQGYDGGYGIIDTYKVNKASMTKGEVALLKSLLDGINETYKNKEVISLIDKFSLVEEENKNNFLIDFSKWGKGKEITEKINLLDHAINKNNYIEFEYSNMNGEKTKRKVEGYKIIFKALHWYIYAYCLEKKEMRIFKLDRIKNLNILKENFEEREIETENLFKEEIEKIEIKLKVSKEIKNAIEENFSDYEILKEEENEMIIKVKFPYSRWIDSMILGFGDKLEVLEPIFLREKIKKKIFNMQKRYE